MRNYKAKTYRTLSDQDIKHIVKETQNFSRIMVTKQTNRKLYMSGVAGFARYLTLDDLDALMTASPKVEVTCRATGANLNNKMRIAIAIQKLQSEYHNA